MDALKKEALEHIEEHKGIYSTGKGNLGKPGTGT